MKNQKKTGKNESDNKGGAKAKTSETGCSGAQSKLRTKNYSERCVEIKKKLEGKDDKIINQELMKIKKEYFQAADEAYDRAFDGYNKNLSDIKSKTKAKKKIENEKKRTVASNDFLSRSSFADKPPFFKAVDRTECAEFWQKNTSKDYNVRGSLYDREVPGSYFSAHAEQQQVMFDERQL